MVAAPNFRFFRAFAAEKLLGRNPLSQIRTVAKAPQAFRTFGT